VEELVFGWDDGNLQKISYYWEDYGEYLSTSKLGDVVLMQSTGILEKNGAEIYEGDVVTYKDNRGRKRIGKINYANAKYYIGNFEVLGYASARYGLEVIGNKYENPELLKEQNK